MSMHGEQREQKPPGVPPRGFVHYQKPISAVHVIPSDNFLYTKRVSMACTASHPPRCILSRRPTSAQAPPPGDQWMGKCCHPNRWTQIALLWSTTTPPTKKRFSFCIIFLILPKCFTEVPTWISKIWNGKEPRFKCFFANQFSDCFTGHTKQAWEIWYLQKLRAFRLSQFYLTLSTTTWASLRCM